MSKRAILSFALAAQTAAAPVPDLAPMLTALAGALEQRYIDADVAGRMTAAIRSSADAGVFSRLQTRAEVAAAITRTIQEVSHDKHLRVLDGPPPQAVIAGKPTIGKVEILPGNVGYLEVPSLAQPPAAAAPAVAAAMTTLARTSALVIDVRGNGGGLPGTVALLAAYVLEAKPVLLGTIINRSAGSTIENRTPATVDGPRFGTTRPIFVLIDRRTASAAESLAYHLQALGRVTVVGEQSAGAANPGGFIPLPGGFFAFVPTGRVSNAVTQTNWEGTGVSPDIVADAVRRARGRAQSREDHLGLIRALE